MYRIILLTASSSSELNSFHCLVHNLRNCRAYYGLWFSGSLSPRFFKFYVSLSNFLNLLGFFLLVLQSEIGFDCPQLLLYRSIMKSCPIYALKIPSEE